MSEWGQSLYESSDQPHVELMDEANDLLSFDLKEFCFEDSQNLINQTLIHNQLFLLFLKWH